jgi:hypothetical protein
MRLATITLDSATLIARVSPAQQASGNGDYTWVKISMQIPTAGASLFSAVNSFDDFTVAKADSNRFF